jgi:hypothetical protein
VYVNAIIVESENLAFIYDQRSAGKEADSTEPGVARCLHREAHRA